VKGGKIVHAHPASGRRGMMILDSKNRGSIKLYKNKLLMALLQQFKELYSRQAT
jgi:hypothetical protein